jgi:hypothetical protein
MIIDNNTPSGNYYYGLYNNKPAYKDSYKRIIYVFKDVSSKRFKTDNNFTRDKAYYKIVFVTNKQLLAMNYFVEVKNCVFDGKIGTRYRSESAMGPYFWCFRQGGEKPTVLNRN